MHGRVAFEASFRRHLVVGQRREVLRTIGEELAPESTVGEVLDAAEALGWASSMADLSLQDLADVLLPKEPLPAHEPELESEPELELEPAPKAKSRASTRSESRPKSKSGRLRALKRKIDADERMSLEEAAELFVPIVSELGECTMQALEEFTGIGRRKLRFHVGQLVREGYLERHGMGRGTHYTSA